MRWLSAEQADAMEHEAINFVRVFKCADAEMGTLTTFYSATLAHSKPTLYQPSQKSDACRRCSQAPAVYQDVGSSSGRWPVGLSRRPHDPK